MSSTDPVLVEVVRNGFVESVHTARVVVTDAGGGVQWSVGEVEAAMFPRSANKPLQAVGMVRAGLDLGDELLALSAASHSGESFHREGVRRILGGAGLDAEELQNIEDYPIDEASRIEWIHDGRPKAPIAMNCSGKHAAMLRTCLRNGWDRDTYRAFDHPLQVALRAAVAELAGEAVEHLAVDGCGAPIFSLSTVGLARAFGRIAAATDGPERAVADAIRSHPEYVSGSTRDELQFHRAVPGLVCKSGAEAVFGLGLSDGRGIALKIDDGADRARAPLGAAVLAAIGVDGVDELTTSPVLGHGDPVGEIRVRTDLLG